jgi:hypothetical protein
MRVPSCLFGLCVLVLCSWSSTTNHANADQVLKVGLLYSTKGIFASYGATVPISAQMWLDDLQAHNGGRIGSSNVRPQLLFADVKSDPVLTANLTADLILNKGAHVLIAPETYLTGITALVARNLGRIPVIAGMAASSDVFTCIPPLAPPCSSTDAQRRFDNLYSNMTPAPNYWKTFLSMLHIQGMQTVSMVWLNGAPDNDVCMGAVREAQDTQMRVLSTFNISATAPASRMATVLQTIADGTERPDILIVCHRLACASTLSALSATGFTPKALGMFECAGFTADLVKDPVIAQLLKFVVTPLQWDFRLRGREYTDDPRRSYADMFSRNTTAIPSALQFYTRLQAAAPPGQILTSLVASQFASLYQLASAVSDCNCSLPLGIHGGLDRVYMPSFFGTIANNDLGQNDLREMVLIQIDNQLKPQIIAPYSSATMAPVFPIPTWTERTKSSWDKTSFSKVVVVAVILCLMAVLAGVLIVVLHDTKSIRATSYKFSLATLAGFCVIALSTLTWTIDDTALNCSARVPVHLLGFTLTLCPILAKTVRILFIFRQKKMKTRTITDMQVLVLSLLLATPMWIVGIIWMAYDAGSLKLVTVVVDPLRPSLNFDMCTFADATAGFTFLVIELVLALGMLILGSVIAFMVRGAYSLFNDARPIAWSMYNLTVMLALTIILTFSFNDSERNTVFLLRSFCVQVSFAISMGLLFAGRIMDAFRDAAWGPNGNHVYTVSGGLGGTGGGRGSGGGGSHPQHNNNNTMIPTTPVAAAAGSSAPSGVILSNVTSIGRVQTRPSIGGATTVPAPADAFLLAQRSSA